METSNKIQLNASLKFSPDGTLLSRDLLVNFRESSVPDCLKLLNDFNNQFKINLGLLTPGAQTVETKPVEATAVLAADVPKSCERCGAELVMRVIKKPGPNFGKKLMGCSAFSRLG